MLRLLQHHLHRIMLQRMAWDTLALLCLAALLPALQFNLEPQQVLPAALTLAPGVLLVNNLSGFYERTYQRPFSQTFARGVMATLAAVVLSYLALSAGITDWVQDEESARRLTFYAMGAAAVVMIGRTTSAHLGIDDPLAEHRLLVVGTGAVAHRVAQSLRETEPLIRIVGFVAGPAETDSQPGGLPVLTKTGSLAELAQAQRVDEVLVALTERRGGAMPLRELLDCRIRGFQVNDVNSHYERSLGQIRLEHLSAHWLIFGDGFNQGTARTIGKRVFDLFGALLLLVPGLPLMALAALAIKIESPGSVLYRQQRVGLGGRLFEVLKLRSMRNDAESDGRPRWATTNDARVTRVGRFIRATRIDELPQIFNVLRGEMSLVGPRPERPFFVDQLTQALPFYAVRHSVKPGLTGWAQVRCDYGSSVEEARNKLQFDLYYVKNHSLFLDSLVLLETVGVVLTGKGAR